MARWRGGEVARWRGGEVARWRGGECARGLWGSGVSGAALGVLDATGPVGAVRRRRLGGRATSAAAGSGAGPVRQSAEWAVRRSGRCASGGEDELRYGAELPMGVGRAQGGRRVAGPGAAAASLTFAGRLWPRRSLSRAEGLSGGYPTGPPRGRRPGPGTPGGIGRPPRPADCRSAPARDWGTGPGPVPRCRRSDCGPAVAAGSGPGRVAGSRSRRRQRSGPGEARPCAVGGAGLFRGRRTVGRAGMPSPARGCRPRCRTAPPFPDGCAARAG